MVSLNLKSALNINRKKKIRQKDKGATTMKNLKKETALAGTAKPKNKPIYVLNNNKPFGLQHTLEQHTWFNRSIKYIVTWRSVRTLYDIHLSNVLLFT
jgi:hypothetical protein